MLDIFGPETPRLLRLITEISDLGPDDISAVGNTWRRTTVEERARAWAAIQHSASSEERSLIQNAALVARHRALTLSQMQGERDSGFWSAAWDAAGALAGAAPHGDATAYRVLVSAMATKMHWLWQETPTTEIPLQRGSVEGGTWDEWSSSSRSGRRR
jgi:hypothetical protein